MAKTLDFQSIARNPSTSGGIRRPEKEEIKVEKKAKLHTQKGTTLSALHHFSALGSHGMSEPEVFICEMRMVVLPPAGLWWGLGIRGLAIW